ncbi:MAG: ATP-binding cassette domain-containing protein [Euryarchaeota archaeon]|nr:ATP-binding cassette domain-containing protein [Euryarchaeota archaeon]
MMGINELRILSGTGKNGEPEGIEEVVIRRGDVMAIAGPTGSGKSLLLSDIEQLANGDSQSGRKVLVDGAVADPFSTRITASLSQNMHFVMDLNVGDFVNLHANSRGLMIRDGEIGRKVIALTNELAGEPISMDTHLSSLSGGQSRALMIADAALISDAPVVLIDEIENAGIDKTRGIKLLATEGKMVLIATHDPTIMLTAQKRLIMKNGSMLKLIRPNGTEREQLRFLVCIDRFLVDMRQELRGGRVLDDTDWGADRALILKELSGGNYVQ